MYKLIVAVIMVFLTGCSSETKLAGFDKVNWSDDDYGCLYRSVNIDTVIHQRKKLLNLRENDIRKTLGEPNRQELYVRGQKFFYYTILSPEACGKKDSLMLELRFSAIGLTSEIMLRSY